MNEIKQCDVMDYLAGLPNNSVDLVLTDPPYFIGYDGGKGWDSQWKSEEEYLAWCDLWTQECLRVLKPNRMMIVWGTLKTETSIKYKLQTSAYLSKTYDGVPQNEIVWGYNWGGRTKKNFARKHEYAWCWSKGTDFLFNDEDIRVPRKVKKNMNLEKKLMKAYLDSFEEGKKPSRQEMLRYKKEHVDPQTLFKKGTIPTCIWTKNNHTTSKDYIGWHPTTKNIDILTRMIKAYTNPGDVVLDVFMGSAATAVAALRTGRSYLGCENDEEYFNMSNERIKKVLDNLHES
ncbi:MAG: site-specific DNA-methyltransferase [Candidatus Bathyarchaeota archaeon]|nr:site-specific DNA-methyltransferase [Candidatus Bathyarchaeota archaeon]